MESTVATRPATQKTRSKLLQLVAETQVQAGASVRTLERLTQEMRDQFEAIAQLTKQMEESDMLNKTETSPTAGAASEASSNGSVAGADASVNPAERGLI